MSEILALRDTSGKLLIPGVEFQSNKLVIADELESGTLKELIRFVLAANNSSIFWAADLLVYLKQTRGEQFAWEVAAQSDSAGRLLDAMRVAENLKTRFNVSFHHHREAFVETLDAKAAEKWLKKAESESWTVSQMRREIRQSRRSFANDTATASGSATLTGVLGMLRVKLRTILAQHPLDEWSEQEIAGLRADLEPLASLIGDIEAKWREISA